MSFYKNVFFTFFIFPLLLFSLASMASDRPNVILISLDTIAADHMDLYGYRYLTTPFLDGFGRENITFDNALSQAAFTLPSHYSIFTGVVPQTHHILAADDGSHGPYKNTRKLNSEITTLTEYLKEAGYDTVWSGTVEDPQLDLRSGLGRGFNQFYMSILDNEDWNQLEDDWLEQLRLLLQSRKDRPTFYFFHSYIAHSPYKPIAPYDRIFGDGALDRPRKGIQTAHDLLEETLKRTIGDPFAAQTVGRLWQQQFTLQPAASDTSQLRGLYDGGLRNLDDRLETFFRILKEEKLYDNSIIIVTSDHGESFGEHGEFFHAIPYRNQLHVPLIVKAPGLSPRRISESVYGIDILPTILGLLSLKPKSNVEGQSLVPLLEGKPFQRNRQYEFAFGVNADTVFDSRWQLLSWNSHVNKLFDLKTDPNGEKDVSGAYPKEVARLQAAIETFKASRVSPAETQPAKGPKKLYWLIPEGARADTGEFNIFRWAREGKLPHIKQMMDEGTYGYSIPDFPSHAPINFASSLTGSHPSVHGVSDEPMQVAGVPLGQPSVSGVSSTAKNVSPIWRTMEAAGKKVMLLSIPGSTAPEVRETSVRGRWGERGGDTFNMIFESKALLPKRKMNAHEFRLSLPKFVDTTETKKGTLEGRLDAHGLSIPAEVIRGVNKNRAFESMRFLIGQNAFELRRGEWSRWTPAVLEIKGVNFSSSVRIKLIKLWASGDFRVRVLYDDLNRLIAEPGEASDKFRLTVGPMVDHADNWPPQLIFEPEDKETFLDEMRMSLDWHKRAVPFVYDKYNPDVFIQDTSTPSQMLESRWWMGAIDKTRKNYSPRLAEKAWADILEMYQGLDTIVGEALKRADNNTIVAFSSDHGVCPLHRLVHLNNLFAKKGWLKFTIDPITGGKKIDWKRTKVIYLKTFHVYINPEGLDGSWKKASGPEFEKLRDQVATAMREIADQNGIHPLVRAVKREDAEGVYDLPLDRIGDLVLEAKVNYLWSEEVDDSLKLFSDPLMSGYEQSLDPKVNHCMWTPFLVWGPGVKHGNFLPKPISHVDQLPTLLKLLDVAPPPHIQGRILTGAFE